MSDPKQVRYLIKKIVELVKFCCIIAAFCFLVAKAPNQESQVVSTMGAFILGGAKVRTKLGL